MTEPRRMYHERKVSRCIANLGWMKEKIAVLEGWRNKKVEQLKSEIAAIENAWVAVRCDKCNSQFVVGFRTYIKSGYKCICDRCRSKERDEFIKQTVSMLDEHGIKYRASYDSIVIESRDNR